MRENTDKKLDIRFFDRSGLALGMIYVERDAKKEPQNWKFVYINDAFAELNGISKERLLGYYFNKNSSGQDKRHLGLYYKAAYENVSSEFRDISEDKNRLLHITCFPVKFGYCACILQDYSLLVQKTGVTEKTVNVFFYDVNTGIVYISQVLQEKYQFRPVYDGLEGEFAKCHLTEKGLQNLREGMELFHKEKKSMITDLQLLSGESVRLKLYYHIETMEDNMLPGYIEDITEIKEEQQHRKLLENALAQAEHANKAKTTFLLNMSHDIRTPMNAIIGFSEIAISHLDNAERVKDCLEKILSSGNHLLNLINDILDMSRIESGTVRLQTKECNIPEMIHSLISIIQPQMKAKQLNFYVDTFDIENEDVYADPLKLKQVFINIISNSIKFTPTKGNISLRIRQKVAAPKGYGSYEFIFKDTGIGMSKEFVKYIFEPFERENSTTKSGIEGTGLGMAITKNIIDIMGGEIRVNSERGKGTEFVIDLAFKLQEKNQAAHQIAELKNLRVLVVDDDFDTCDSITKMLAKIGMRSEWTTSGRESVYRVKKAVNDGDKFHVCIIDWMMPEQNGVETVRKIRKLFGDELPIIILTAYDWTDIEQEAKEAGVTAFCSKPLFMSDLKAALLNIKNPRKESEPKKDDWILQNFEGKRVLVVEDNELNCEITQEVLEEAGFVVEMAGDGSVAVRMVEESEENYYDLVLMDIQMPVMDGHKATLAIRMLKREDVKNLPIIAMTANAFEEDKEQAFRSGMDAHIAKPLDIQVLLEILAGYMR